MSTDRKLKKNQVEINGKIYTKDITAILVKNQYYPRNEVAIDTSTNQYDLIKNLKQYNSLITNKREYTSNLIKIIINTNNFSIDHCESILNLTDEFVPYLDREVLMSNPSLKHYISRFNKIIISKGKYTPRSKIYSISDYSKDDFPENYKDVENSLSWVNYTYGFELETSQGNMLEEACNAMGFAKLYDGSISGAEYVSDVFKSTNLHYLDNFLKLAYTCTDIDRFCSFHIHIGNVPKSDRNLLSMYVLFQRLTDELNQLIVPYKKDLRFLSEKLSVNGRDHCKNLPKLLKNDSEEIYKLFKLNSYKYTDNLETYINSTSKWNINGRYYNVNFINYICKNENSNTVEIRSLQSTYNFEYIITWLLINTAIIDYAINNSDKVLNSKEKIELNDCLDYYIKNTEILNILKTNIVSLKNLFYNEYYYNNNSLIDVSSLDNCLSNILTSYDIFGNNFEKVNYKNSIKKRLDD